MAPQHPLCSWMVDKAPEDKTFSGFERILTVTDFKRVGTKNP